VAEHPLQGFHVRAGRDRKTRGSVTEIVGRHSREVRIGGRELCDRSVESSPPELCIPQHPAHRRREKEVAPVFSCHVTFEHQVEKFWVRLSSVLC